MVYTEIKVRDNNKYYYRVVSIRKREKVNKKRIYLGSNLLPNILSKKERIADEKLRVNKVNFILLPIVKKIIVILKKYGVKKAGIFGSYARKEQTKSSDIDIIIDPPKGMGLKFVTLARELEEEIGKKVDLVSYNGIHPMLKQHILKEEVPIYG